MLNLRFPYWVTVLTQYPGNITLQKELVRLLTAAVAGLLANVH